MPERRMKKRHSCRAGRCSWVSHSAGAGAGGWQQSTGEGRARLLLLSPEPASASSQPATRLLLVFALKVDGSLVQQQAEEGVGVEEQRDGGPGAARSRWDEEGGAVVRRSRPLRRRTRPAAPLLSPLTRSLAHQMSVSRARPPDGSMPGHLGRPSAAAMSSQQ